jgi:hypothetical protein
VVTICTTRFNIRKLCVLSSQGHLCLQTGGSLGIFTKLVIAIFSDFHRDRSRNVDSPGSDSLPIVNEVRCTELIFAELGLAYRRFVKNLCNNSAKL